MKSIIEIEYTHINRKRVNEKLHQENPKLIKITENLTADIVMYLKRYFKDKRILTKMKFKVVK